MSSAALVFCVLFLGVLVCSVLGGDNCTIDVPSSFTTKTSYCEYGCCGTAAEDNRACCENSSSTVYVYVGGGAGGSVGFFIICVCCYYKYKY